MTGEPCRRRPPQGLRTFRVSDFHASALPDGEVFGCIADMYRQLQDVDLWSFCEQSENMSSELVRLACRPAGVLYALVLLPALSFPYKLFSVLNSPDNAAEVLQTSRDFPCLLDSWSAAFLHDFDTVALLGSPVAQQCLASIALDVVCNTFDAERGHSSNARRSRMRSHTHIMALHDLSLMSASFAAKPWMDFDKTVPQERLEAIWAHLCNDLAKKNHTNPSFY